MERWLKKRTAVHGAIVLFFVVPLLALHYLPRDRFLGPLKTRLEIEELQSIDDRMWFFRKAPAEPRLVFLMIDIDSNRLEALDDSVIAASRPLTLMHGGFPYPREVYGEIATRLFESGARAVAFDVYFRDPNPNDPIFAQVIEKYRGHLAIGMNFSDNLLEGQSSSLSLPPASLVSHPDATAPPLGFLNFWPDADGIVRQAQYRTNLEKIEKNDGAEDLPSSESLAARAVEASGSPQLVPHDLNGRSLRFTSISGASRNETRFQIAAFSLYRIFDPDNWAKTFHHGEYFRDKIVVVGPYGDWAKDQVRTPLGEMNGAEVHLNAINSLLENEYLFSVSPLIQSGLILLAGLSAFSLAYGFVNLGYRFLGTLAVLGTYALVVIEAFNGPGWLLPVVAPASVFLGSTGLGFIYDFVLNQIEKLQLRSTFERYVSKDVARHILDNPAGYQEMHEGARKPVTVLFSDVRGFTTLTETSDSHQLVAKLNEYLTAMVDCVFRHDGALDKFIGDAVMAVWGNTSYHFGPKEDALRAVRAARLMLTELDRLNQGWRARGESEWRIGVGLNHGEAIVGDMGSIHRKEFAVIGDAVNLASRLESLTKQYQLDLLLGESVAELVADHFHLQTVDSVQVVGKTQAVRIFTILGEKPEPLSGTRHQFLAHYEEGYRRFTSRDFAAAAASLELALQSEPANYLAESLLESSLAFVSEPPDSSWTGVRVMKKK